MTAGDLPHPEGSLTYRPREPVHLGFALVHTYTVRRRSGVYWWDTQTPQGPARVAFRESSGTVRADGWGPGLDWAFTQLPTLLGADDVPGDFRPDHPVLQKALARFGSARIGASGRWYEALATVAIGQRVVTTDAAESRRGLSRRHGEPACAGSSGCFPTPEAILGLADHDFHRVGIERSRARVIRLAATYRDRLERLGDVPGPDAIAWLQRLPGVGPWTAALTATVAGGDPDAVPVGDLHIPRVVTFALTGEEGDDDRMLEVLEPYVGHRQRVVRLAKLSGAGPPRHTPRAFRYDISRL